MTFSESVSSMGEVRLAPDPEDLLAARRERHRLELYPLLLGESIEVRAFPTDPKHRIIQKFLPGWADVEALAAELDADYDVYFGVAPRHPGSDGRLHGRLENVARCPVVWLDLDAKGKFSKDDRQVQLQIASPNVLVDSGGGYHAYWLLDADLAPKAAQRLMKGMAAYFECDDTSDPTRILRVPNTRNYKTDPPRFVNLIYESTNGSARRWNPDEMPIVPISDDSPAPSATRDKRIRIIATVGIPKSGGIIDGESFDGRDAAMFEYACFLRDEGYSELETFARCREANLLFDPPLDTNIVATKMRSAFTREAAPNITEVVEPPSHEFVVSRPPRIQIMSLKEVLSFEEPPIEFLAGGMFARSSIEFIAHPPKSGKTTVGINWGLRMAAGMNGAGLLDVAHPYRVLLWQPNADMSPRRTREWIRKISAGLGIPQDICFDFWCDDGESKIEQNIVALEERCADYDIIMVDSLNRFLPGVDEVDTRVVADSFNVVRRLRTAYPEVCWMYLVQVGKNSAQHLGSLNPSFALRGNSAVAEAYDTMIQLATPKNTEKDPVKGLALNRHILFHGRDADAYRGPFRTRYNLETHVLEWEADLTPDQALGEIDDGTDRESQRHQRDEAVDLLKVIFNDAEEESGERRVRASDAYEIGDANGLSKKVMGSALRLIGGSKTGSGKNTEWVDFVVEVEEA